MQETKFGYALANGTVGVYDRNARYWRIKVRLVFAHNYMYNTIVFRHSSLNSMKMIIDETGN